jgi:hypothetical protein
MCAASRTQVTLTDTRSIGSVWSLDWRGRRGDTRHVPASRVRPRGDAGAPRRSADPACVQHAALVWRTCAAAAPHGSGWDGVAAALPCMPVSLWPSAIVHHWPSPCRRRWSPAPRSRADAHSAVASHPLGHLAVGAATELRQLI